MARKLTDISISGLNKSAIIQIETGNCILTLHKIDSELNKASKKILLASELLNESADSNIEGIESKKTLWETLRDATLSHFRQARAIYLSDKSLLYGLERFLRYYSYFEPNNLDFTDSIQNINDIYAEVSEKYNRTIQSWVNLAFELEGEVASKKWRDIAEYELMANIES